MLDGEELDPDLEERLHAARRAGAAASGLPLQPLTDVQKRENAAYGHAMAAVSAVEICGIIDRRGEYDVLRAYDSGNLRHPVTRKWVPQGDGIVQMMAAERFHQYNDDCATNGELLVDGRLAPSYCENDPLTATRLYVLTHRIKNAVALETPYDWQRYLREALGPQTKCDAHLLHRCYDHQATPALMTLVYKRGEYLFAWKICDECKDALSWISYSHPDYAGPLHRWMDDGERPPYVEF